MYLVSWRTSGSPSAGIVAHSAHAAQREAVSHWYRGVRHPLVRCHPGVEVTDGHCLLIYLLGIQGSEART